MAHYTPGLTRFLVCVLFHEAKMRKIPMTRLVDEILTDALKGSSSWEIAKRQLSDSPEPDDKNRQKVDP